jgi:hypothetical protein
MSEKNFKTPKNRALGASKEHKIVPGDIVSWKSWSIDLLSESFETREGLLLEVIEENRLQNIVLIAKIMPFGASEYEFIPLISVKKSRKGDYL